MFVMLAALPCPYVCARAIPAGADALPLIPLPVVNRSEPSRDRGPQAAPRIPARATMPPPPPALPCGATVASPSAGSTAAGASPGQGWNRRRRRKAPRRAFDGAGWPPNWVQRKNATGMQTEGLMQATDALSSDIGTIERPCFLGGGRIALRRDNTWLEQATRPIVRRAGTGEVQLWTPAAR